MCIYIGVSPNDVTDKCFWSLSLGKVEIAVFTDSPLLVSEPLTLCCAAIVLQTSSKRPAFVLSFFQFTKQICRTEVISLLCSTEQDAVRMSVNRTNNCSTALYWNIWCAYTGWQTIYICGICISEARCVRKSLYCSTAPCVPSLLFVQKVMHKNVFTTFCTCLFFFSCFNSCT